ncbi:CDP-glucose 4,6-dehydratase [Gammaproteobacteria bacterium]|jgi:CDP-glucose 4,6-dehydratase|nr:CDP-glucose 4,6-dehydratase [Gammaproteobacteria bacterium]
MTIFNNIFFGKKVLITGNTGFKGSWLTIWLLKLGAEIIGISKDVPSSPSMFCELELESKIHHHFEDITNKTAIKNIILDQKPDFIFHLAAQAIVSESYENPFDTLNSNIMGTGSILDALKNYENDCIAILITSDKCYDNLEWPWGYKETDKLGGKDIYSGSKGAAELVINSYFHSFLKDKKNIKIGIGRAGNVIGGGDWAKDRIIVDCIKSWSQNKPVEIRSPLSTRPWQHVLEPLSGYLTLAQNIFISDHLDGSAYNFGPKSEQNRTVLGLLKDLSIFWNFDDPKNAYKVTQNIPFHEAGLLKLNCDKALLDLKWEPNLNYHETVNFVGSWYQEHLRKQTHLYDFTENQIQEYEAIAQNRSRIWINGKE